MEKSTRTIEEAWQEYRARVLPKDAGKVQVEETRKAFFAGFTSCLFVYQRIDEPDFCQSDAEDWLVGLTHEAEAFSGKAIGAAR